MGLTVAWCKKVTNTEFLLVLKFYNTLYQKPLKAYTTFYPYFNFLAIQKNLYLCLFLKLGLFFLIPFQTTCSVFPFVHSLDIIAPLILLLIIQVYSF